MNLYEVIGYPLFFVSAFEMLLGFILLSQNPHNSPVNKTVAAFSFFSSGFALSTAIMYLRASRGLDFELFARANWIGWLSIPAALQFVFYLKDEQSRAARLVGLLLYPFWFIMLCLSLSTELLVSRDYTLIPFVSRPAPLEMPARMFGGLLILWLVVEIIRLKKQLTGIKKKQLDHFFHGILIFAGGGALTAGFLQVFGGFGFEPGLASYFSLPWAALTFYAITRYSLFDIRNIISRTLSIVFLSIIFSCVQIALFKLFEPSLGAGFAIFISLPLVGFLFFGTPFSKRVVRLIQRVVLKGKFDYQHILKESTKAIITILNLDELLGYVIDSIKTSLRVENICLVLKGENGGYLVRHGSAAGGGPEKSCSLDDEMFQWIRRTGKVVTREELEGSFAEEQARLSAAMKETGAELIVPLSCRGQLLGLLALGKKGDGDPYIQSDIELLEALAGHAAVAIQNARLYEEARRVKESLQESEEKFRALAETLPAAVFIHRGGNFLYTNPAGVAMTGYSMEEILNRDFWGLVHPDSVELVRERARMRLEGVHPPPQYEFRILRKDGLVRWVLMTAGRIEYEGQPAIIGTIFDITDRKRAEEEKAKLYGEMEEKVKERTLELEEAKKVAEEASRTKSEFLANISHELRTPLNSIIGFSEIMKDGMAGQLSETQKEYLKDIWESGKHLLRLINNILDLSKIEAGMMKLETGEVSLKELIEASLFMFREKAMRHRITLSAYIPTDIGPITADEIKLKQVLLNLIANALKFTPEGGSVRVAARQCKIQDTGCRMQDEKSMNHASCIMHQDADFVEISVADTGIGMSQEDIGKLFQPFRQLDTTLTKKYEGTGLGLHLSKKIVELHGGAIWAESEPGNGSRFTFFIPVRSN